MPTCAAVAAVLVYALLAACLNPMPDDFPSNDGDDNLFGGSSGGGGGRGPEAPSVPDNDPSPSDGINAGSEPGGGAGASGQVPPPPSGGGASDLPDAGADGGTPETDGSPDGDSADGETDQ